MTDDSDITRWERLAAMMDASGQPRLADHFRGLINGTVKPLSLSPPYNPAARVEPDKVRAEARRQERETAAFEAQCKAWEEDFYDWVADMDDGITYEITTAGLARLREEAA